MKGLLKTLIVASLSWLVVAVTGCVTIESPDLAIQAVAQYRLHQVKDDLFVAVEQFRDKERILKYFGADLLSKGILPVLTVVENHNRNSSFILLKEQFSLISSNRSKSTEESESLLRPFPETAGAILGGTIALYFSTKASQIRHNLMTRELRMKAISPGGSQCGFVYFKLPDKHDLASTSGISVKAQNLQTDEVITFVFPCGGI